MHIAHRSSLARHAARAAILAIGLFGAIIAQAGTLTFTDTTVGGPTWNRPLTLTNLSGVGTNVAFDVTHIRVDQNDVYTFVSSALAPAGWDNYLVLYANAFTSTSPLTNIIALNDDYPGSGIGTAGFTLALSAGVDYFLVETGFENTHAGSYRTVVTGAGGGTASIVGVSEVPEPASMLLLGLGLAGLVAARRRA